MGLTEGNIFQGELTFDQLLFNRPVPGCAQYRSPIKDLWIGGSSTHPAVASWVRQAAMPRLKFCATSRHPRKI